MSEGELTTLADWAAILVVATVLLGSPLWEATFRGRVRNPFRAIGRWLEAPIRKLNEWAECLPYWGQFFVGALFWLMLLVVLPLLLRGIFLG